MRVTPNCDSINSFNICDAYGIQMFPDIAYGSNTYLVAWSDGRFGETQDNVYAARVTASGTVLDPNGFPVGPLTATYQYSPSVAFSGTRFLVIWGYYAMPSAITGRFVYPNGTMSDTFGLATASGYVYETAIAYSGINFLVIWTDYDASGYVLKGQLVSINGTPIGSTFTVASPVHYYIVNLCYDGTNYFVVYCDLTNYQIYGRKYNLSGTPVGSALPISNSSYYCYYPNVASGSNNHYLNVWGESRNTYPTLYGNVDIEIIGIEEQTELTLNKKCGATMISGQLNLPAGKKYKVFDITGRQIDPHRLMPGIYYVELDGKIEAKIVKVR